MGRVMLQRTGILVCVMCLGLAACGEPRIDYAECVSGDPGKPTQTQWAFNSAEGLDALLLIGAASGDEMQSQIYVEDIARFRGDLSPQALAALDAIGAQFRAQGSLLGPYLVLLFTGADFHTLDNVLAAARDPDGVLRPAFESTVYWNEEDWPRVRNAMPGLVLILENMQANGFSRYWMRAVRRLTEAAIERLEHEITCYDIIPEQARLLGRDLDPRIELVIVHYSLPYGIRVQGQRFLAHHTYTSDAWLRTAGHEILHPPFDPDDEELLRLLEPLRADPWMSSIVEDHEPGYGYNSFMGVVNEDSTEALDQLVAQRLGFALDPHERWRGNDGGMHMLAAALYEAMTEESFDETGGSYSDWLKSALDSGLLSPAEVRRRAALVVGQDAVDAWGPDRVQGD